MKKSTNALLCSVVVFPGSGLFVLGEKKRAYAYLVAACLIFVLLVVDAYQKAQKISDQLVQDILASGGNGLDQLSQILPQLPKLVAEQMQALPSLYPAGWDTAMTAILAVIWLFGIVDTYLTSQKNNRQS